VPKQLLSLASTTTMLRDTIDRVRPLVPAERTWIVTAASHARGVRRVVPDLPARNVLVEPVGRNTAAAVALAALHVGRRDPRGVMMVLPADHVIGRLGAFRRTLRTACVVAQRTGALVTLGVEPTRAETGYGWLRAGRPLAGFGDDVSIVGRFIEKPSPARAAQLFGRGDVYWNSGMFAWRVDAILAALRRHVPAVLGPLERAFGRGRAALERAYGRIPAVSIDVGVLERASSVAMVRAEFPWNDVGSWAAVEALWHRPGAPNATRGRALTLDGRGCVIDAGDRVVAVLGLDDVVVVSTDDAMLVCRKDRAQDVRRVVDAIERAGWGEVL
jgi:mannose-1-phosphate guanylyltransferase